MQATGGGSVSIRIIHGDCRDVLRTLEDESVHMVVTSPPYFGLRSYLPAGHPDKARELGAELTPSDYVAELVGVFREVRRVLRRDGTVWLNLGDSYNSNQARSGIASDSYRGSDTPTLNVGHQHRVHVSSCKPKDLIGIPWLVAFALRADGWYLRSDIIWHKCLSGGAIVYAKTVKGEMPMTVKDLVRLPPETVQLWDGSKWNQCLEWHEVSGDPDRKAKSSAARSARYRGKDVPVQGDIEIELRSGERIGCTRDHKWPTNRGLISSDQLAIGDVVDTCLIPEPEDCRRPSSLDDDMVGWLVGLYIAEGSRSENTIQIASHQRESTRFARLRQIAADFDGYCSIHNTGGNCATANLNGPIINGIIDAYVSGRTAKDKHLSPRCWKRSNRFLLAVMDGYLSGDGCNVGGRWRLGFCDNDALAADLRVVSARIGGSLRLRRCVHKMDGREFPGWRGSFYFDASRRRHPDSQIVEVRQSRARAFYDIVLQDDPHLFALGSGVLTHNSNPMPESVTDRPTKAHEYLFLLSKSERYYYDATAIAEPFLHQEMQREAKRRKESGALKVGAYMDGSGRNDAASYTGGVGFASQSETRNRRSVWTVATQPFSWGEQTVRQVRVERDADVGGKKRKASPDCPVHAGRARRSANGHDGGHAGDASSRTAHTSAHPVQGQLDGFAAIETSPAQATAQPNLNLLGQPYSASATSRSTETRRTDPAPGTSPACSASAQTPSRILDTSAELSSCAPGLGMHESNISVAECAGNPDSQTVGGTAHTSNGQELSEASSGSECSCEYYIEETVKVDHFATFPPNLIEPCIKAGTSEKGCCAKCGAPWKRVVEKTRSLSWEERKDKGAKMRGNPAVGHNSTHGGSNHTLGVDVKTIGWSPSCSCDAAVVPATVLDPFGGAGTTALVADRLQRNAILIELNADYSAMAKRRLDADAGMFSATETEAA